MYDIILRACARMKCIMGGSWLPSISGNDTGSSENPNSDRSIMYTLDGVFMALVLMSGLLVAMSHAPDGGDFDRQLSEMQQESDAQDLIAISAEKGSLKDATLYWDDSAGEWVNANSRGEYVTVSSSHPLSEILSILEDRGFAYGIIVEYLSPSGALNQIEMVNQGTPGSRAVSVSQTVTLQDDTNLYGPDSSMTVSDSSSFFAPDAFSGPTYNILTVHLVVWRTG
jgi:hypothetical protein